MNRVPDYIVGCGVNDFKDNETGCYQYTIPAGTYIKDLFNGEGFEQLVTEVMAKREVEKYAKNNQIKIKRAFAIEVYPDNEKLYPEMYTLTPITMK